MIKELCDAFCDALTVRTVPCGVAVTTPFVSQDADPIGFYIVESPAERGKFRLEDDGTQVPVLEASGIDLARGTRSEAFSQLLGEYDLTFNSDTREIHSAYMPEADVPRAALRFMAALLRLQDFLLLSPRIIHTTFREDAIAAIQEKFSGKATVEEMVPISSAISGHVADVVIRDKTHPPLAVFLATSDEKALQALVIRMETAKYTVVSCRVVLLLERMASHGIREPTLALAMARLDFVGSFRGVEADTMDRLEREFYEPTTLQ